MLPCLLAGALGVPQAQWQTNDGPLMAPGALDPPERSPSYVMGIVQPGSVFIRGTPKSGTTWLEVIGMELLAEACKTCGGNLSSTTSGGEVISTTRPRQAHEGRDAECKCAQSAHLYGDADKHRVPGHDAVSHPSPYVEKEHLECAEREGGDHLKRCLNATAVATSKAACEANYRYLLIERDPRAIALSLLERGFAWAPLRDPVTLAAVVVAHYDALRHWARCARALAMPFLHVRFVSFGGSERVLRRMRLAS